ncbi:MAG: polysaccharide deacetylase family protein [Armatimonadota bacterium]
MQSSETKQPSPIVLLSFDMETDIGSWTPFYDGLLQGTPRIIEILAKHDVPATFFYTGEAAQLHPQGVRYVETVGHEVGCHSLFHETIGDELFPIPGIRPILPEECYHRIELATEMVQQVLGRKVTAFRAPRLWGSTAMVNALEDLGYHADASYPLFYHQERLQPYHPSREAWTQVGDLRLVEIPNFADLTVESHDAYGRDRDQWPLFRTEGADAFATRISRMSSFLQAQGLPAVICLYMHAWEFHPMPQGSIHYGEGAVTPDAFIVKNCGEPAVTELDRLISLLKAQQADFLTVSTLAARYHRSEMGV